MPTADVPASRHPGPRRQLRRHLGAAVDGTLPPGDAAIAERLAPLLAAVHGAYAEADRARALHARAMAVRTETLTPHHERARHPEATYRAPVECHPLPMWLHAPETGASSR